MNFGNVLTAMVTPFNNKEAIDYKACEQVIEHLIANGSDGLVIAGTTGESPTLTHEEKIELFRFTVKTVAGRVPVIAGTGSNNTKATIELTKEAEEIGVDACMLVGPYYNKPSQEGMYMHFKTIAESTTLPVMLYNIPGRSVVNINPETLISLAEVKNIVAVKDASGDMDAMTKVIANTPEDFSVYSGEDSLTLPSLAIGGAGIVSVSSHVIGNEMQEMIKSYRNGDVKRAATIHQHVVPVMNAIFSAPSPTPVKEALKRIGIPVGGVRLPLIGLNETEKGNLYDVLDSFDEEKESFMGTVHSNS